MLPVCIIFATCTHFMIQESQHIAAHEETELFVTSNETTAVGSPVSAQEVSIALCYHLLDLIADS